MAPKSKNLGLEVSSTQIHADLLEIKERIAALETIASLANRPIVESYVKSCLDSKAAKNIMIACEQPRTKEELRTGLGYATTQALDHHLTQVRQYDLLQKEVNEDGKLTFGWSNLFSRLPKKIVDQLLDRPMPLKSPRAGAAKKAKHD
jgi:hypothetical protein